jgi:hypothetical protein
VTVNRPAFFSEEELVKQLQGVLRSVTSEPQRRPSDETVGEARALVEELAQRVYNDPSRWGIADVPDEFRDDVVNDTLIALLFGILDVRGRQTVVDWFSTTADAKYRRLSALAERQRSERERVAVAAAANPGSEGQSATPTDDDDVIPPLFDLPKGGWAKFEAEYPRDAFALRLRHQLKRTPEQMATMLEAPSSRAISMRLDRARERFRVFCEQQGVPRRDLNAMLTQLSEEPSK